MTRINQLFQPIIFIAAIFTSGASLAHHAMEIHYFNDAGSIIQLQGVIKKFTPLNPHSYLVVSVQNEDGEQDWVLESLGREMLTRSGWPLDMLTPGEPVNFTAFPARNGKPMGRLQKLKLLDRLLCSELCDLTKDT